MQHCYTSVRCAKPIVEARQDGDQVIAVLRSALHRQPSTITASASNDCIAPWVGAARLVGHVYVCCACSWLMTETMVVCSQQSQPSSNTSTWVHPPTLEWHMELSGKRFCRLFGGFWRRFRVSLIYGTIFLVFFSYTTDHSLQLEWWFYWVRWCFNCLWWLIRCYAFDN